MISAIIEVLDHIKGQLESGLEIGFDKRETGHYHYKIEEIDDVIWVGQSGLIDFTDLEGGLFQILRRDYEF